VSYNPKKDANPGYISPEHLRKAKLIGLHAQPKHMTVRATLEMLIDQKYAEIVK
jgi:hypothetical protein